MTPTQDPLQHPQQVYTSFRSRQLPLAVFAGVLIATVPPAVYAINAYDRLNAQAKTWASYTANALAPLVASQPTLWRYNAPKVVRTTANPRILGDRGALRITGCNGDTWVSSADLDLGPQPERGPSAWEPIVVSQRTVAWVHVVMEGHRERTIFKGVALGSLILGSFLGWLLFALPARVIRNQLRTLQNTLQKLASAESHLIQSNHNLQERIQHALSDLQALSERVISIQEEERRRIARDLHDGLGQLITGLRLELEQAQRTTLTQNPNPNDPYLEHSAEALNLCNTILDELRRVVRDLHPVDLQNASIADALRATSERFEERSSIPVSFRTSGTPRPLPEHISLALLRVHQEALTNVSKHANASEVGVRLTFEPEHITLDISDDGQGFDPATIQRGLGLTGMHERMHLLSGSVHIESDEDGTHLRAQLPHTTNPS